LWSLPRDVADPWLLCELAETLGMTLSDLGARASNYEVCVIWPAYKAEKNRIAEFQQHRQEEEQKRRRRAL
jgi:hypothetical protein